MLTSLRIIQAFDSVFLPQWNTRLRGGFDEPLYLAADESQPAEIRFARDSIRSALHEVAHWCLAGEERRALPDYGYWYRPDGRNASEQEEFFKVEVKPQAIEMALAELLSVPFEVSCDNLNGKVQSTDQPAEQFGRLVEEQLKHYKDRGFPQRVQIFIDECIRTRLVGKRVPM